MTLVAAVVIAHLGLSFRTWLEPLAMLSASLVLLFSGPGPLALDNVLARRSHRAASADGLVSARPPSADHARVG